MEPVTEECMEDAMDEFPTLTDAELEAMEADAETLMTLLIDEEAEGEVEAGRLLLEWVPGVCRELAGARAEIARLRGVLEYYADLGLWERARAEAQEVPEAPDTRDIGAPAREALRTGGAK